MARLGKGKPMDVQAKALLHQHLDLTSRHEVKQQLSIKGSKSTGKIHSIRTFNKYSESLKKAGEWLQKQFNLRHLNQLTSQQAQQYLQMRRSTGIGQKQLDTDRNSLQFLFKNEKLVRVMSGVKPIRSSKRYTTEQVNQIIRSQSPKNSLATRIASETGLRAHELLTIRRADELTPSLHRNWRQERFQGREGVRYVVTGKGGLRREVMMSHETSMYLEAHRLAEPRQVTDRGVYYQQHYDISGGNKWSKSFGDASQRVLGWSKGAHGLRHTYVQQRMKELQGLGKEYKEARDIISQELGHFRGDVVETYLR